MVALAVGGIWLGERFGALFLRSGPPPAEEGSANVPSVVLGKDGEGQPESLKLSGRHRPLVIFALSTQCEYCRQNLPSWQLIADAFEGGAGASDIIVLSLSSPEETTAYLTDAGLPQNVLFIDANELQSLGLPGVPGTLALGPDELVMRKWIGVLGDSDVSKVVQWAGFYVETLGDR